MHCEILRLQTTARDTIGAFYVDGIFTCWTVEDPPNYPKIAKHTRVPTGTYEVRLRTEGGKSKRYRERFPDMHKGMLHLQAVPDFTYVYIHIGNEEDDTEGCPLVGNTVDAQRGRVGDSTGAYKRIYPPLSKAIESGEGVRITIRDIG